MQKYKFTKWEDISSLPLTENQKACIESICLKAKEEPFIYNKGVCGRYARLNLTIGHLRFRPAVHTLVYLYYNRDADITGFVIDHIDRNTFNNSIHNLRLVTTAENVANTAKGSLYNYIEEIRELRKLGYGRERLAKLFNSSFGNMGRFLKKHSL